MAMASQLNAKLLDINLVPKDITFVFQDSNTQISAHKSILAMASPVFSKMFYGPLKETKDEIMIEETTEKAFEIMIGFIYGGGISEDTVEGLFAVENMAERYDIKALTDELINRFKSLKLTNANVVKTADTALQFGQFVKLSRSIFLQCGAYLRKVLTSVEDIVTFANKHAGDEQLGKVALSLVASFKDVTPPAPVSCQKCGQAAQTCSPRLTNYKGANVGDDVEVVGASSLAGVNIRLCDKRGRRGRIVKRVGTPGFGGSSGVVTVQWTDGTTGEIVVGDWENLLFKTVE